MSFLNLAVLTYGSSRYPVTPNETLPLPLQFDFSDPEGCARKVMAIMSNASGGHALRDCKLKYNLNRRVANLTANGAHVFYCDDSMPKFATVEEAVKADSESIVIQLGNVVTDQYGDGWKRAHWFQNQKPLIS